MENKTQDNTERIIRLEVAMERIEKRLDEISLSLKEVLTRMEKTENESREVFATKRELEDVKEAHDRLSNDIKKVVMAVLIAIAMGLLALLGINP